MEAVSAEVKLNYFDPQKPMTLQVVASMAGLGAVLFQEDRLSTSRLRQQSPGGNRKSIRHIEQKMLAVVFDCDRYHNFLFGQYFIVELDHEPLESIHLKHVSSAPARLRRGLLRLQPHTMVIKYKVIYTVWPET